MKKTTLMVLVLGFSFFITGKCLAFYNGGVDFPASSKNLAFGSVLNGDPKPIKPESRSKNVLAPSNDNCATATPITSLPYFYEQNDGASATDDGLVSTCSNDNMNDGMWYTVVGNGGNIAINVTPTVWDFYAQIGVFTGSCGDLICVGTVDAALENNPENYVIYNSVVGTTYYINVGRNTDYSDVSEGNFTIDVHTIIPSTNNDCSGATAITSLPYFNNQEDGATATNSGIINACLTSMNEGVWYKIAGDGGNIKVTVTAPAGGSFDPVLGIFTGACGDFDCSGFIDATGGGQVETYIISESDPAMTYYINIGDHNNHMGNFTIDVSTILTPVNDACAGALEITSLPYSHEQTDAIGATNNEGFLSICGAETLMNDGLWYTIIGDGSNIKFTVKPTQGFDIALGVFSGVCGELECVGNADVGLEGYTETYTIADSVIGTKYYINIGSYSDDEDKPEGNFTINVKSILFPANDSCVNPTIITTFPYSYSQTDAEDATNNEGIIEACTNAMNDGVWYSFEGDGNTIAVTVDPDDNFNPQLGVFTGNCNELVCEGAVDTNYQGGNETILINSVVGTTYFINVGDGSDSDFPEGNFSISVKILIPLVNDACDGAIDITTFPFSDQLDATNATNNDGSIAMCNTTTNDGIWYKVTGNGGDIAISATSVGWDARLSVYTGSCGDFTCYATKDLEGSTATELVVISDSVVGTVYYINIGYYGAGDAPEGLTFVSVVTSVMGVEGNDLNNFTAYPNPVTSVLNLSYGQNVNNVAVFNLLGQQVITKTVNASESQIDMSTLSAGTYLVKVTADNAVKTIKVVKQ